MSVTVSPDAACLSACQNNMNDMTRCVWGGHWLMLLVGEMMDSKVLRQNKRKSREEEKAQWQENSQNSVCLSTD